MPAIFDIIHTIKCCFFRFSICSYRNKNRLLVPTNAAKYADILQLSVCSKQVKIY